MGSKAKKLEEVADAILEMLDQGTVPWRKPWDSTRPENAITGKAYRGFNSVWLAIRGFGSPYWAGFKQWKQRKCTVRAGQHGSKIFIPIIRKWKDADGEDEVRCVGFRTGTVFNAEQVEGGDIPVVEERDHDAIAACEQVVAGMPNRPEMRADTDRAYYVPSTDTVHVPLLGQFHTAEGYYSTVFHELAHATGHKSRLDRDLSSYATHAYSKEELVAEFAAAMLCGHTGIDPATLENSAAYIATWRKRLSADKSIVVKAASAAQRAADHILGVDKPTA